MKKYRKGLNLKKLIRVKSVRKVYYDCNLILIIALLVTVGIKVYLSDISATAGSEFVVYEDQLVAVEKEHERLQNQYLQLTSLNNLAQQARERGYISSHVDHYTSFELASR